MVRNLVDRGERAAVGAGAGGAGGAAPSRAERVARHRRRQGPNMGGPRGGAGQGPLPSLRGERVHHPAPGEVKREREVTRSLATAQLGQLALPRSPDASCTSQPLRRADPPPATASGGVRRW